MKYKYWFEKMLLNNFQTRLIIRLSEELIPVQIFLCSDIQREGIFQLELINKVLRGQSEYEDFTGNACYVEVRKDKTKIEYMFTNKEAEDSCEIETSELKELIELWIKEQQVFYKK